MKDILKKESIFFIIIPIILSIIGIIFIFSTGNLDNGQNTNLYLRQIIWIVVGLIVGTIILSIDYYYFVETSIIYYIIGLILLLLTLILGKEIKGAQSWLGVGSLGIQASELMKICYVLFYAKFLRDTPKDEKEFITFIKSLLILFPPLILVLLQPDLGTAIVFCSIYVIMSFLGFKKISILLNIITIGIITTILILSYAYYQFYFLTVTNSTIPFLEVLLNTNTFFTIALILIIYALITFIIELVQPLPWIQKFTRASLVIGLSFLNIGIANTILKPYQWNRIIVFINPEFDKLGSGYNAIQSKIAIGAGGLTGQGLFQGTQNLRGFLPEKHTDFIFAILAEESGFLGCFIVLFLYSIYFLLIIRTILSAKDPEGSYIVSGILAIFFTHIIINIGMNIGIMPITGLPLPFISYGGSFYLTCIIGSSLILNIYNRRFIH